MNAWGLNTDYIKFFRDWLSDPFRVIAVAPSGRSLARLMTTEISSAVDRSTPSERNNPANPSAENERLMVLDAER